jgi:arylsulfatase A-like enzyme
MNKFTRRALCALPVAAAAAAQSRKPNFVVILADDLGSADLGFTGCKDIPTPNLDKLRAGSVRFLNAYISHPFCSPTRAGLMTGRYQHRFGHENNPWFNVGEGLDLKETILPKLLKTAGYHTGLVGKWHLGDAPEYHPNARGFDEFYGFLGGGHQYFPLKPEQIDPAKEYFIPLTRNREPVPQRDYLTRDLAREAASFIERNAVRPFFLYTAFNAPHTPMQVPEADLAPFHHLEPQRAKYAAMVKVLDEGVGRILAALADKKLDSNTLVFFLSDNGGPPQANGSLNPPLREGKGTVYEGGIRTPMLARWPDGQLKAGSEFAAPVISLDIAPTILAAAGASPAEGKPLDGVDLLPYLRGKKKDAPHESLCWRTGGGAHHAMRQGAFKLVKHGAAPPELFNLEADPSERHDLAAVEPDRAKTMLARLMQWDRQMIAPAWPGASTRAPQRKKQP